MYQKILVPVDGGATSMRGLAEAIKVAKSHGSQLRLLHIVNGPLPVGGMQPALYGEDVLDALRQGGKAVLKKAEAVVREHALDPDSVLLESIGRPVGGVIVEQAEQWPADLIVMGTHGRRGLSRLVLGSDAELVVRSASVPVLLVRSAAGTAD
jgi:nucleotide-binding universal stress UspA family protein